METTELIEIISRGEDSSHQFKIDITNATSLAGEFVAFSNSSGGILLIGVDDDGNIVGLSNEDIRRINQLISNTATNNVEPPINPKTENISSHNGIIIAVSIPQGISKPYMDNQANIWVKNGSDKRKVTSREEIRRMFQDSRLIHADETPARGMQIGNLDKEYFSNFIYKQFNERIEDQDKPIENTLESMNLMKNGEFNISGALLFTKNPSIQNPSFMIKSISLPGDDIDPDQYIESIDHTGKLEDIYNSTINFIKRNIRYIQNNQGVNAKGTPEIPLIVFEELIANALIHRDYFTSAPVRVFIFKNRIEIISPGHLPNSLTVENIKRGNSNMRNPTLASFASKIIPYRGLGSGILRALKSYPNIKFEDDRDGNQFIVTIDRPE